MLVIREATNALDNTGSTNSSRGLLQPSSSTLLLKSHRLEQQAWTTRFNLRYSNSNHRSVSGIRLTTNNHGVLVVWEFLKSENQCLVLLRVAILNGGSAMAVLNVSDMSTFPIAIGQTAYVMERTKRTQPQPCASV